MKLRTNILLLALLIFICGIATSKLESNADPCIPSEVEAEADGGGIATELNGASSVFIKDNRAYVASFDDDSLSIFDITDPTMILELGSVSDNDGIATDLDGATGVFVKEDRAYVVSNLEDSLTVFDVSDPAMILQLGLIDDGILADDASSIDGARGVFVKGNYAYVVSDVDDSLSILDISDPTMIFEAGSITELGTASALNGAFGVYVKGNKAYVTSNVDDSLSIFDISNPASIVELGVIQDSSQPGGAATALNGARNVFVRGNYAYVASFDDDSLSIFDISDPTNIIQTDFIVDDGLGGDATELDGAHDVFIIGNNAYVASNVADSISILDISDPTNIKQLGFLDDGVGSTLTNGAISIFVKGNYAYVASNVDDSLSVFDVKTDTDCVVPGVDISGDSCLELINDFSEKTLLLNVEAIKFEKRLSCKVKTTGDQRIKIRPKKIKLKSNNAFSKVVKLVLSKKRVTNIRNNDKDLSVNLKLNCKNGEFTDDIDVDILPK